MEAMCENFLYRIHEVFQKSWMHQIAKLPDPTAMSRNVNLSLEYIIQYDFKQELLALKIEMDVLQSSISGIMLSMVYYRKNVLISNYQV